MQQVKSTTTTPTLNQSISLVKNLLGTTLGAIVYLRNLFPEANFRDTSINGLALKSLAKNYSSEADELMDWMEKGVFDALEKRYLKTMVFGIFLDPNDPDKLQEGYTFGFSYPSQDQFCISLNASEKQAFSLKSKNEIMRATTEMLRRLLVLTQTLEPLPKNAYVTMKLFYYEDVTPLDYDPPFFTQGDESNPFYFEKGPEKIKIGRVESPYHMLTLSMQAASNSHSEAQVESPPLEMSQPVKHVYSLFSDDVDNDDIPASQQSVVRVFEQVQLTTPVLKKGLLTPAKTNNKKNRQKSNHVMNSIDRLDTETDTQGLISELKKGIHVVDHFEPPLPPASMISLDLGQNHDDEIISEEELQQSQNEMIDLIQESGQRATRSRVTQMLTIEQTHPAKDADSEIVIKCPCLVKKDLSAQCPGLHLIQCQDCGTWGHAVCFGHAQNTPVFHSCYECSHLPGAIPASDLNSIAWLRLGLGIASLRGIESRVWLSKTLGMPGKSDHRTGVGLPISNQLISQLQKRGLLTKAQKTAPYFLAIKTTDAKAACRELYSDRAFNQAVTPQKPVRNAKKDVAADENEKASVNKNAAIEMTFSDATTDPPLPSSPLFGSIKRKSKEMDLDTVPNSQSTDPTMIHASQESTVISTHGQHPGIKKRKVSVVKKTITVL